jgi:taurine dioxygenase
MTTIDVRPITGSLGAEVLGVDLAQVDDELFAELREHWLEHLVLFFPGQQLTPDAHVELARRFGEPEVHPYLPKLDDEYQEIVVLDSDTGVRADFWHTDVAFSPTPPMASILHLVTTPPAGGDTIWSNQYEAYETLSAPMRELLDGLTAVHDAGSHGHPEVNATHPAVRVHPETGRRSLFVNGTSTSHFVELHRHESDALLAMLLRWCERPEFHCRYHWGDGGVAIWDNRCTQHYAVDDYRGGPRVGQRITILGDAPVGP